MKIPTAALRWVGGPALTAALALALAVGCTQHAAKVTFVLKNSHTRELSFNMDRGWQPNLFAYTGKPPRARSIILFASHCTASCEAAEDDRCPHCPQPSRPKDLLAAQKFERVQPGEEIEVPWDGRTFVYQKTKGRRNGKPTRCECYSVEPAPPATYTVKACGLRLTKSATERSRLQCVEGTMTLPSSGHQRIELDFGDPQPSRSSP